jgi:hypothetical protein
MWGMAISVNTLRTLPYFQALGTSRLVFYPLRVLAFSVRESAENVSCS